MHTPRGYCSLNAKNSFSHLWGVRSDSENEATALKLCRQAEMACKLRPAKFEVGQFLFGVWSWADQFWVPGERTKQKARTTTNHGNQPSWSMLGWECDWTTLLFVQEKSNKPQKIQTNLQDETSSRRDVSISYRSCKFGMNSTSFTGLFLVIFLLSQTKFFSKPIALSA